MFEENQLDQVFDLLARVGEAVVSTIGSNCEVVVHDLRSPEHTVVAISGNLTRRSIGSPVPDPEFLPENVNRFARDLLLYPTTTPFGKTLLSSTVWVRNNDAQIVGALCINMDFSDIRAARDLLDRALTPEAASSGSALSTFATSPDDFITVALNHALSEMRKERHQLEKDDKIALISRLNDAGVFGLRRASEIVAEQLGISRASVYAYLKELRETHAVASNGRKH